MALQKNKAITLILLYVYFASVIAITLLLQLNYVIFVVLFFGLPALCFSILLRRSGRNLSLVVFSLNILIVFTIEIIAHQSKIWYEPSVLGIRVLGSFPIDTFIFGFCYILFIISFYEFVFDNAPLERIHHWFRYLLVFFTSTSVVVFILHFVNRDLLDIPYMYSIGIVILMLITIIGFKTFPKIIGKISFSAIYLFLPSIAYELVALKLGHWYFEKGNHIGYIDLLGQTFPFEEFLLFTLWVTALLVVHETFVDDRK